MCYLIFRAFYLFQFAGSAANPHQQYHFIDSGEGGAWREYGCGSFAFFLGNAFTDFIIDLSDQVHTAIPGCEVSIASPAVNWSGTFNIPVLNQHLDFFMVMGYDYYWNGSSQAGPVSPLYSMAGNYDYNFSKTISYYQSQGVDANKMLMGVPYYARQWPTEDNMRLPIPPVPERLILTGM